MSRDENENDSAVPIVSGLVGFGLGALVTAALMSRQSPRDNFIERLRTSLAQQGIALAAAELGRGPSAPVWMLTLRLPAGLVNVKASVPPRGDPFAPTLADDVAQRVASYLQPFGSQVA